MNKQTPVFTAHRGEILHFLSKPNEASIDKNSPKQNKESPTQNEEAHQHFEDGLLIIKEGRVHACGPADELLKSLPKGTTVTHHENALITPGFVDTHVHYPQCEIIASYGEQLLEWLDTYTFPAELQFDNPEHAQSIARFFLDQLLSNGTTTALVFGTVPYWIHQNHPTLKAKHSLKNGTIKTAYAMLSRHDLRPPVPMNNCNQQVNYSKNTLMCISIRIYPKIQKNVDG